jgi:hypothetical protein
MFDPVNGERRTSCEERSRSAPSWEDAAERRGLNARWIVVVACCTALGLALVAHADAASRAGHSYGSASPGFWVGVTLVFAPAALRCLMAETSEYERLVLVVAVGLGLYAVKILASPYAFSLPDEYVHLRNTQDILQTHRLFGFNPLLPTAAYYPGLAALTAGLVDVTGFSPFVAGLIVIGAARALLTACFFLIATRVTKSHRAGAAASLIYAANPMFLFWSSAFAYENLALPLAAFVVWWIARTRARATIASEALTLVAIAAVTVTHHVVGLALAALLTTWWALEVRKRRATEGRAVLARSAVVSSAASVGWLLLVAHPAWTYLFAHNIDPALRQTWSLLSGHTKPRHFYSSGGLTAPEWQTVAGFVAVAILLFALPWGIYRLWRRRSDLPITITGFIAVAFPVSLIPRIAPDGVAISGRSGEYIFAGVGCVLGLLTTEILERRLHVRVRRRLAPRGIARVAVLTTLLTVVFIGDITIGTAFYQLLPESSNPSGYPWSVQSDAVQAATWSRLDLGVHQRFAASAIDAQPLATSGEQDPVSENQSWPIFFPTTLSAAVVADIRRAQVDYVLLDWRMIAGVPGTPGFYFSPEEPNSGTYRVRFPAGGLQKFVTSNCTRIVHTTGSVQVVDVSGIANGSCIPAAANTAIRAAAG